MGVMDAIDGEFVIQPFIKPVKGEPDIGMGKVVETQGQHISGVSPEIQSIAPGIADGILFLGVGFQIPVCSLVIIHVHLLVASYQLETIARISQTKYVPGHTIPRRSGPGH